MAAEVGKPIRELFGMKALENYLAVLETDHDLFSKMTFEQEVRILVEKC